VSGKRRTTSFWLLGAVYWIAVVAVLAALSNLVPHLLESRSFFYAFLAGSVAGGFVIVGLFRSKS
jgi:hypothetical protein